MHPVERLLNLTALLLESPRPLTFGQIRERIPAYQQGALTTAKRMFERDKDVLRDAGIPVELVPTDPFEVEEGYTIPKELYYLPDIDFTQEEMSALFVAAHTPAADGEAEHAALKLQAASRGSLGDAPGGPLTAGPDLAAPRLVQIAEATLARRSIRFRYRPATGDPAERHVDPYALVWRAGHWYVVGLDRDRKEPRSFRLSRLDSEIEDAGEGSAPPGGFDAREHVQAGPWGTGEPAGEAMVAFAPEVAWWAIRSVPGARVERTRDDGWVEVTIPGGSTESLASWVLSFGADAAAVSPPELRDEVIRRLEATLDAE